MQVLYSSTLRVAQRCKTKTDFYHTHTCITTIYLSAFIVVCFDICCACVIFCRMEPLQTHNYLSLEHALSVCLYKFSHFLVCYSNFSLLCSNTLWICLTEPRVLFGPWIGLKVNGQLSTSFSTQSLPASAIQNPCIYIIQIWILDYLR